MSTPSLHKLINVVDRLKRKMSELLALREAVARAEQSYWMATGSRELSGYPKVLQLPAAFQLSQKPAWLLSSPSPSLSRLNRVAKLRKHSGIRTSRPLI